jgi:hypothetical protein
MSRWLEAARQAPMAAAKTNLTDKTHAAVVALSDIDNPMGVKSVKSVLSERGIDGDPPHIVASAARGAAPRPQGLDTKLSASDPESYLAYLRGKGPSTYGATAVALGWGATRAWRAEARLRAAGLAFLDKSGRAAPVSGRAAQ